MVDGFLPLDQWTISDRELVAFSESDLEHLDTLFSEVLTPLDAIIDDDPPPLLGAEYLTSRLNRAKAQSRVEQCIKPEVVMWITDIFWHLMIFKSPLYPTTRELSSQISLMAGEDRSRPIRRLDAPKSIDRSTSGPSAMIQSTKTALARGFDANENASGDRRRSYSAMGNVLQAQFDVWRTRETGAGLGSIPMALTVNFDLEFERGLAQTGRPYHVAVPVYLKHRKSKPVDDGSRDVESIRWLVSTFDVDDANPSFSDLATPKEEWIWLHNLVHTDGSLQLSGPLLVKLNGSPCHEIPGTMGSQRNRSDIDPREGMPQPSLVIEHAVALGEYDLLQISSFIQWSFGVQQSLGESQGDRGSRPDEEGIPSWLISQIRESTRYWMLLGQRMKDWNSRLLLHTIFSHNPGRTHRGFMVVQTV